MSTRREFLIATVTASGGLCLSHALPLWALDATRTDAGGLALQTAQQLTPYIRIEPNGAIVIGARSAEIGQGVRTSLPMILAEELDVRFEQITVEQLPHVIDLGPEGPVSRYGAQGAGGSTSISEAWVDLRQAGAEARARLRVAAAGVWNAPLKEVDSSGDGHIVWRNQKLTYGELAQRAAAVTLPEGAVQLKSAERYQVIGKPQGVVDARAIVTGKAQYGIDARLPGALVAMVERSPWIDGRLRNMDLTATKATPGVIDAFSIAGPKPNAPLDETNLAFGVAVVGKDTWSVMQGRRALKLKWEKPALVHGEQAELRAAALTALDGEGESVRTEGDFKQAMRGSAKTFRSDYEQPFLAHATLEPQNALVDIRDDGALLIGPLQSPGGAGRLIADMTGLPRDRIEVRMTRAGGGFGRRLENDFVAEAVRIALKMQQPIRLIWSREDDMRYDYFRPYGMHRLQAGVDAHGKIIAWSHQIAATPRKYRTAGMESAPNWIACMELDDFPAGRVPHLDLRFHEIAAPVARGWWRAPLPTFVCFPVQSFVDELAHELKRDPLDLRLEMLGADEALDYRGHGGPKFNTARMKAVLNKVAEMIGWRQRGERALGIAGHFVFGGYTAHAVELTRTEDNRIAIERVCVAADIGRVINPLGAESQLQGGTIDGLSTALRLAVSLKDGRVEQSNFHQYPLMRMSASPKRMQVHLMNSTADPAGAGEMGLPSAIPALTNALFALTGKRIRELPIGERFVG
jgi:isoquinoline 1-oxidoreductase beta subunit